MLGLNNLKELLLRLLIGMNQLIHLIIIDLIVL